MKKYNYFLLMVFLGIVFTNCEKNEIEEPIVNSPVTGSFNIIQDNFENKEIVIVGSETLNMIVSFERKLSDGTLLNFSELQGDFPNVMIDEEGNQWDITGKATTGTRTGEQLTPTFSTMGYWFSWSAFYPNTKIYNGDNAFQNVELTEPTPGWLINVNDVFAGTGQDAIASIDNPMFIQANDIPKLTTNGTGAGIDFLDDEDLVIGVVINGEVKAYPTAILDWHEIVNDDIGGESVAVIYCPLTGTGFAWNRNINNNVTTFGVSGLLHNNNIIPYDRSSNSRWSQLRGDCVNGQDIGNKIEQYQVIETTWATWKRMYPQTKVLTDETGAKRDYADYPYGVYREHPNLLYPVTYKDNRLFSKERVHGVVINGSAKVYRFDDFK